MAVRVVHLLEMIEIDEHQRELIIVALRTVNLRLEDEAHVPGVVQTSAIVGDGQLVNSFHMPGIFECDGSKVGKSFKKLEVAIVKTFWTEAIDQLDDSEAGVAEFNRDGNDGLRFGLGLLVYLREEASVFRSVRHDH